MNKHALERLVMNEDAEYIRARFVSWLRMRPNSSLTASLTAFDACMRPFVTTTAPTEGAPVLIDADELAALRGLAQWLIDAYHSDDSFPEPKEIVREARAALASNREKS